MTNMIIYHVYRRKELLLNQIRNKKHLKIIDCLGPRESGKSCLQLVRIQRSNTQFYYFIVTTNTLFSL